MQQLYIYVQLVVDHRYKDKIPKLHEYSDALILYACSKFKKETLEQECDMYLKKYEIDETLHREQIMKHIQLLYDISQEIFN